VQLRGSYVIVEESLVNKWGYFAIAGLVGAAAAAAYNYLFAPAPATTFDGSYQSRLDWALAEGERAAAMRELEMRAEFEASKLLPPPPPPQPPVPTVPNLPDIE
jgi:hypothetical protein